MIHHNPTPDAMKPTPTDIDLYARALALSHAPRQIPIHHRVLDFFYWIGIMAAFGWIFSMAIDRDPPVKQLAREIVNPSKQVRVGERLLIHGVRERLRSCEIARRWWIIDGAGRRIDFETERFDAYGPLGREEEVIGPYIPLDAMPGRGRLLGVVAYDCNPLQRALGWSIVSILSPLEFEILPRAPAP
ncbi:hypothetical protein SAMN05192568_106124 [Methylobacterium pseudosasicola]|uniref:Uncharacterized protein n=2 Tax=Methylobacterium pseudosasicola TaxID=582667 RepID=A0A1I4U100_9HYPH|nr:hypothetical protein SAMN05192568_106124 [Methylobacterium pseudosasicola]